jgi:hypothetical protein
MWLLSKSDDIIVSAASTYGRVSYGMKGKQVALSSYFVRKSAALGK